LANYGLIQTEATKFNSALKEIQDLEKKNKEMEDKIKKIEMEIDESKGRILCRICLDHKDLSKVDNKPYHIFNFNFTVLFIQMWTLLLLRVHKEHDVPQFTCHQCSFEYNLPNMCLSMQEVGLAKAILRFTVIIFHFARFYIFA